MTIKDFDKVNCSALTLYTIKAKDQVIRQFRVDYNAQYDVWSKQKDELNSFMQAKVTHVDHGNNCIAVFAQVIE